jgi:hypothetical protein
MADKIKTGPSLAEKSFSMFEKSWQMLFVQWATATTGDPL